MQRIRFCGAAGCECEWESIPGRNYKLCPLCRHPVTELHFPSNQVAHLCRKLYSDPPKLGDQLLSLTGLLQPVSFEDTYSELLRETHEFSIRALPYLLKLVREPLVQGRDRILHLVVRQARTGERRQDPWNLSLVQRNYESLRTLAAISKYRDTVEKELPSLLSLLTDPQEDPHLHGVIATLLGCFPHLDKSLDITSILLGLFEKWVALPCPDPISPQSTEEKEKEREKDSDLSLLWAIKKHALPCVILTLALIHQGTDFFTERGILEKVLATSASVDVVVFSAAAGCIIVEKERAPLRAMDELCCRIHADLAKDWAELLLPSGEGGFGGDVCNFILAYCNQTNLSIYIPFLGKGLRFCTPPGTGPIVEKLMPLAFERRELSWETPLTESYLELTPPQRDVLSLLSNHDQIDMSEGNIFTIGAYIRPIRQWHRKKYLKWTHPDQRGRTLPEILRKQRIEDLESRFRGKASSDALANNSSLALGELPVEVLEYVLSMSLRSLKDLLNLSYVSKQWNALCHSDSLWRGLLRSWGENAIIQSDWMLRRCKALEASVNLRQACIETVSTSVWMWGEGGGLIDPSPEWWFSDEDLERYGGERCEVTSSIARWCYHPTEITSLRNKGIFEVVSTSLTEVYAFAHGGKAYTWYTDCDDDFIRHNCPRIVPDTVMSRLFLKADRSIKKMQFSADGQGAFLTDNGEVFFLRYDNPQAFPVKGDLKDKQIVDMTASLWWGWYFLDTENGITFWPVMHDNPRILLDPVTVLEGGIIEDRIVQMVAISKGCILLTEKGDLILFGEIGGIFTSREEIHFARKQFLLEKFDAALREHERLYTTGFFQLERFWEAAWNIKFIAQHAGVDIPALKNLPRLENVRPIVKSSGLDWRHLDAAADYRKQVPGAFREIRSKVEEHARFGLYYLTVPVPECERIKSFALLSNTMYYITENDKVYKGNEAIEELDGQKIIQTVQTSSALLFLTGSGRVFALGTLAYLGMDLWGYSKEHKGWVTGLPPENETIVRLSSNPSSVYAISVPRDT